MRLHPASSLQRTLQAKGLNKLGIARNRGPGLPAVTLYADVDMAFTPLPLPTVSESTTESGRVLNAEEAAALHRQHSATPGEGGEQTRPSMDFLPARCDL